MPMSSAEVWCHVDQQRADLSDLLAGLTVEQWQAASLCGGWSVRDVVAHLTHLHAGLADVVIAAVRGGFRFDAVMDRLVARDDRPPEELTVALRAMVGSRRRPPTRTPLDPLMDIVVHGQDIAVPLRIDRPIPADAAVAVANHLWTMRFPMNPRRTLVGFRLVADDADFAVGSGPELRAPIRDLILALGGRWEPSALSSAAGPA